MGGRAANTSACSLPPVMIARYSPALAKGATIFFYGTLDGVFPQLPIVDMLQANATFHPYSLFNYVENPEALQRGLDFVYAALKQGQIAPQIDRVYPMDQYRDAWDYLSQPRESHGKVVVETGNAPGLSRTTTGEIPCQTNPTDCPACVRSCAPQASIWSPSHPVRTWHGFWTCDRTVTSAPVSR